MEFGLALILTLVATPIAAASARRLGVVDHPGPLKPQAAPVPYFGGLALMPAIIVAVIAVGRATLLVPLVLALALGVADDVHPLPARARLAGALLIGAIAGSVVPGSPLVRMATGASAVVLLNAVNLLDGQDGLAGSVGVIAALGFALLGGAAQPYGLAMAGGLAGFLVFNRPPARIYLGDGGAYLLGVALALAAPLTEHGSREWSVWFALPLLVGVPVLDTAVTLARRLRAGRPLFEGDRSHIYDQLIDRGHSVGASTVRLALVQVGSTALGVLAASASPVTALTMTVVLGLAGAVVVVRLRLVDESRPGPSPDRSSG